MAAFLPWIRNQPQYFRPGIHLQAASASTQDDGTTIRVLVVYTPAAQTAAGGVVQMEGKILEALELMNTSFANSAVNAQVVLAGAQEVTYAQSEEDLVEVLDYLRNPTDSIMDNVHLLRDQSYADLVNLVVGPGTAGCYNGYQLAAEGPAFAPLAFSIVRVDCMLSDLGFLQALGKNMGAREDWYVDITITPYSFSHGYIYIDDAAQTGWRTIMTRRLQCDQHQPAVFCDHLPYWSNPNINHPTQNLPMGVPGGTKTNCAPGVEETTPCDADNASTLNLNANTVANFRQGEPADILLVNDEAGASPEVEAYYTQALQTLGVDYDTHNTGTNGADEPSFWKLTLHSVVVWFTGLSRTAYTGLSATGETALSAWLDKGGCLLISSQDYAHASQPSVFMQQYLGVQSITRDSAYLSVTGSGPFNGLGPYALTVPDEFPPLTLNFSDSFVPASGALTAFAGSQGSAALFNLSRTYRTAYLGFPLETLPTPADRAVVLQRFLGTCRFWSAFLPMLAHP